MPIDDPLTAEEQAIAFQEGVNLAWVRGQRHVRPGGDWEGVFQASDPAAVRGWLARWFVWDDSISYAGEGRVLRADAAPVVVATDTVTSSDLGLSRTAGWMVQVQPGELVPADARIMLALLEAPA